MSTQKEFYQSGWFAGCNDDEQAPLIQTTLGTKSARGARLVIKLRGKSVISQKQIDNAKLWVNENFPDFGWQTEGCHCYKTPRWSLAPQSLLTVTLSRHLSQSNITDKARCYLVNVAQFPPFCPSTSYVRSHIYKITRAKSSHKKVRWRKTL